MGDVKRWGIWTRPSAAGVPGVSDSVLQAFVPPPDVPPTPLPDESDGWELLMEFHAPWAQALAVHRMVEGGAAAKGIGLA